jgi:hypothetical protein
MPVLGKQQVTGQAVQVSAPFLKFAIGTVASLCAVFVPRLIAALSLSDGANITFVTGEYALLAVMFSGLIGLVVALLEWQVPRAPGDTFMTTLGIPAILAGALSVNQNTSALQDATRQQNELANALSQVSGIAIEPAKTTSGEDPRGRGSLMDVIVQPVYAQGAQLSPRIAQQPSRLAIQIRQPEYFIVLARGQNQQEAQAKASGLKGRLNAPASGHPLNIRVQQQGNQFLVVVDGGPRIKSDALLEALRMKDTFHVNPTLVEVAND